MMNEPIVSHSWFSPIQSRMSSNVPLNRSATVRMSTSRTTVDAIATVMNAEYRIRSAPASSAASVPGKTMRIP